MATIGRLTSIVVRGKTTTRGLRTLLPKEGNGRDPFRRRQRHRTDKRTDDSTRLRTDTRAKRGKPRRNSGENGREKEILWPNRPRKNSGKSGREKEILWLGSPRAISSRRRGCIPAQKAETTRPSGGTFTAETGEPETEPFPRMAEITIDTQPEIWIYTSREGREKKIPRWRKESSSNAGSPIIRRLQVPAPIGLRRRRRRHPRFTRASVRVSPHLEMIASSTSFIKAHR